MNIVCIGAHPDDAEYFAGGTMTLFSKAGHRVVGGLTNQRRYWTPRNGWREYWHNKE